MNCTTVKFLVSHIKGEKKNESALQFVFLATTKRFINWAIVNVDFSFICRYIRDFFVFGMIRYLGNLKKEKWKTGQRKEGRHTHTRIFSFLASLSFVRSLPKSRDETRQDTKQMTEEKKTDGHNFGQFQSRQNDVDPSDVTFRPRGIFEKHVEESIFNQIGSAAAVHFVRPASCGYFMQSSLTKKKYINKNKINQILIMGSIDI